MYPHANDFLVTEGKGKWYLRATHRRVVRQVAMLFFGGVFMIGCGVWMDFHFKDNSLAYWRDLHVFAVLGCLIAILLCGVGIWVWWIRHVSVSIDTKTGAVHFGNRQICSPDTVESVLLRRPSNLPEDEDRYFFEFRLTNGTIVSVPSPSFAEIGNVRCASELAEQLAAKLNVSVVRDF
jgi:hypothetical protein